MIILVADTDLQASIFDAELYEKALRQAVGVFTDQNHPEWKTLHDVRGWLISQRCSDERCVSIV